MATLWTFAQFQNVMGCLNSNFFSFYTDPEKQLYRDNIWSQHSFIPKWFGNRYRDEAIIFLSFHNFAYYANKFYQLISKWFQI